MTDVLVCGSAVIDMIFRVDAFPTRPEKYAASGAEIISGGCAANAAIAIARLGGTPRLAARAGDDLVGDLMVSAMRRESVDTSLVLRGRGGRSAFSSIYIDPKGERQIMAFRGANLPQALPVADLGRPGAVLADTRWPEGADTALAHARSVGCPGVLDGEAPVPENLMRRASHVAFSAQGLRETTGEISLEAGLRALAETTSAWVCVTDGPAGTTWMEAGTLRHMPAARIAPVDTLGAGDVWHGAFALRLAEGAREAAAVAFANAAASLKCLTMGGARGAPTRSETEDFMKRTNQ